METRERLLEVTLRLLAEQGYDGFGLREVAELAGTKTSSIYHFYGGKDELCRAAFEHFATLMREDQSTIADPTAPALDRIRSMFDWLRSSSTAEGWRRDFGRAIEPPMPTGTPPPSGPAAEPPPFLRALRDPVVEAVESGQLRLPPATTADELADLVALATIGLVRMTARDQQALSTERALALFLQTFLAAHAIEEQPAD